MTLRGVSLKDSIVFNFSGPVLQNAVCLGDVDNDGASELVVASVAGDLAVYSADKCPDMQPWRHAKFDGQMITSVHVGDLRNEGRNVLLVVTAEGWLHLFDFSQDLSRPIGMAEREEANKSSSEEGDGLLLKMDSSPESVKKEEAGQKSETETVQKEKVKEESVAPSRKKSVTFAAESAKNKKDALEAEEVEEKKLIYPSFTQRIPANVKEALIFDINDDGLNEIVLALTDRVVRSYQWQGHEAAVGGESQGQLVPMNKWEFGLQVGSITRNVDRDGSTSVIVAQPGGALLKLRCRQSMASSADFPAGIGKEQSPDELLEKSGSVALDYEPLIIGQMRNLNVTCEIQGGLAKSGRRGSSAYAVATLDGALVLVRDERVVWTMQTGQHLFSIRKLDVNGDGSDEIVATSWNGTTYVVTQEKHAMEIVLDSSVIAFTCGQFTVDGRTMPALVYVHRDRVVVYYKLELKVGPIETLLETRNDQEFQQMLDSLKIKFRSSEEAAKFNELLLYCSSSH